MYVFSALLLHLDSFWRVCEYVVYKKNCYVMLVQLLTLLLIIMLIIITTHKLTEILAKNSPNGV